MNKSKPSKLTLFHTSMLIIPEKADPELDSIAATWETEGGSVLRLGRFWEPFDTASLFPKLYGNEVFCRLIAQQADLRLVSPEDDLLLRIDSKWLNRNISLIELSALLASGSAVQFPVFVKPLITKQFQPGVYRSALELHKATEGLEIVEQVIVSEVVSFSCEVRAFVFLGSVLALSIYEGFAEEEEAGLFIQGFLSESMSLLPVTCVVDFGFIEERGWSIIEFNPAWGSGLNGCDPKMVVKCIYYATEKPVKNMDIIGAHAYSSNHEDVLLEDSICGCFYCLTIFDPCEIEEWIEDKKGTALCPYCGIDSVIGESSGYPITKEFLAEMQGYWF